MRVDKVLTAQGSGASDEEEDEAATLDSKSKQDTNKDIAPKPMLLQGLMKNKQMKV